MNSPDLTSLFQIIIEMCGSQERGATVCLQPPVKQGGGSVIWSCISVTAVGTLVNIGKITNVKKHNQLLIYHAIPFGKHLIGSKFMCQHDNEPKHTDNAV